MPHLLAVGGALPGPPHAQQEVTAAIGPLLTDDRHRLDALHRLHAASGVMSRHLALPLEEYRDLTSFGRANDLFLREGRLLAEEVTRAALAGAGLPPDAVDFLLFTSVTGISAPSIDAGLVSSVGLRPDVRRMPSFGLGCAGGAAGIARVHDYLLGHPDQVGMLVSVELCSLTFQAGDDSTANLVASGLFGDGAAAVVLVGDEHPRARGADLDVLGTRSGLYPGTADQLGWHVRDSGFEIMLAAGLPETISTHLAADVGALLAEHGLTPADVATWVVHAGGPRIFDAVSDALGLPEDALAVSRESLTAVGNLSSASVLHVLADTLRRGDPAAGGYLVVMAFGPGVSAELVLLQRPAG
ncbi:type III polyketide synthase [Ruania zhangjianzhongii]|uniref:type III polyketide synthase n=1 Tax=Ruania zhangjianzhongii TaxID=2603206 RepID=UPI0011C8E913|nr:3-oxoacyl-[acyl-carrier-protein] synthase III C-terminal domain-containing protein [Ruania zhangjianzhongii]